MKAKLSIWFEKICLKDKLRRKFLFFTGILLTLTVLYPAAFEDRSLKRLDYKVFDLLTNIIPDRKPSNLIVIVDIDDRSLQAVGQWPWPRYRMGHLLKILTNAGTAVTALDVVFAEEDRTSLKNIKKSFKDDFGIDIALPESVKGMTDNDGYLAYVISQGSFVLSDFFLFGPDYDLDNSCRMVPANISGLTGKEEFYRADGVLCNIDELTRAASGTGFFNAMPDLDGILRRLPVLISYKDGVYTGLALETYMKAAGSREMKLTKSAAGLTLTADGKKIPLNGDGTVLLNFNNVPKRYKYYSAADVLSGRVNPDSFKGKIVLVGSSAAGMNDLHSTSSQPYCPGVEVHATFIDNLINGNFFRIPEWSFAANIFSVLFCGLVISFFSGRSRSALLLLIMPTILVLILFISYILLSFMNIYISPTSMILTIGIVWLVLTFVNYYIEERRSLIRTRMLSETQAATIRSMASVAETRDPETGGHIFRTQYYVKALAEELYRRGMFRKDLSRESIDLIYMSTPLHDVGKVGIPDDILLKPAKLTGAEFEIMKTHAQLGADIISRAESGMSDSGFLHYAVQIALSHHEKWDGSGYPKELKGNEIPLSGRLMAIADVYDALISKRHYKEGMTHAEAMEIMKEGRGKHFDPDILDVFFEMENEIMAIASKYRDED